MPTLKHVDFEVPDWGELQTGPSIAPGYANHVLALGPAVYWRSIADGMLPELVAGNHAAAVGDPQPRQPGMIERDPTPSIDFNGDSYALAPAVPALADAAELTWIAWLNLHAIGQNYRCVFEQQDGGSIRRMRIFSRSDNDSLDVWLRVSSGIARIIQPHATLGLTAGVRHQLAITWDGQSMRLFVDGALVDADDAQHGGTTLAAHEMHIGSAAGGTFRLNGSMQELAVFGYALSSSQIAGLHDRARGVPRLGD